MDKNSKKQWVHGTDLFLTFKHSLFDFLEITTHYALRFLPIPVCSSVGYFFGRMLGPRHKEVDQRLRKNIKYLRPDLVTEQQMDALVANYWGQHGRVMAEFSVLRRIWQSDRVKIEGLENYLTATASGRPIIAMLLHLGNWETVGSKLVELVGKKLIHVYQMLDDKVKLRIAENVRKPYADYLIPNAPYTAKKIYNKLKAGYSLCLAVDELMNHKLHTPAFGRPLNLSNNLAFAVRFAKLTNAVLIPVYSIRTKGVRFQLKIEPPIFLDFSNFDKRKLYDTVEHLDKLMDPIIRKHVDQWYYATALDLP